jgi:hypothetical protein
MSPAEALRGGWCVVRQENLWLWSERSVQMAHIRAALLDGSGLASRVTLVIMPKARHHALLFGTTQHRLTTRPGNSRAQARHGRRPPTPGQLQTSGEVRDPSDTAGPHERR